MMTGYFYGNQYALKIVTMEDKIKKLEKQFKELKQENHKLKRDIKDVYSVLYTVICNSHRWFDLLGVDSTGGLSYKKIYPQLPEDVETRYISNNIFTSGDD